VVGTIDLYERFRANTEDEIDIYDQLDLPLPERISYRLLKWPYDKIVDIEQFTEYESKVICHDGFEIIVLGNADELFIKINDLKNNDAYKD
jgi:hypothetical protein